MKKIYYIDTKLSRNTILEVDETIAVEFKFCRNSAEMGLKVICDCIGDVEKRNTIYIYFRENLEITMIC